ncbi:MAG: hypothetical protein E7033_01700 [Akkermansiaceae bacterium]|nr:hypothetical protein [Akkermansiaceae bacterium]
MRTCLCILLLFFSIVAIIATVVYHTSINASLTFAQKQNQSDYINVHRSYHPPVKPLPAKTQPAPSANK